jgi:hypothetical protein
MKCPKCNYISFDYNQVCPKCNKDLSPTQKKMNLSAFKCNPPFFLGTLTGDASDVHYDLDVDKMADVPSAEDEDLEMHLDEETLLETAMDDEDISLDLSDLEPVLNESEGFESLEGDARGQTFDLEDLSLEEGAPSSQDALREVPYDMAEKVTTEIKREKTGASGTPEDIEIEMDLEEPEDKES